MQPRTWSLSQGPELEYWCLEWGRDLCPLVYCSSPSTLENGQNKFRYKASRYTEKTPLRMAAIARKCRLLGLLRWLTIGLLPEMWMKFGMPLNAIPPSKTPWKSKCYQNAHSIGRDAAGNYHAARYARNIAGNNIEKWNGSRHATSITKSCWKLKGAWHTKFCRKCCRNLFLKCTFRHWKLFWKLKCRQKPCWTLKCHRKCKIHRRKCHWKPQYYQRCKIPCQNTIEK